LFKDDKEIAPEGIASQILRLRPDMFELSMIAWRDVVKHFPNSASTLAACFRIKRFALRFSISFDFINLTGVATAKNQKSIGMLINKRIPLLFILGSIKAEIIIVTLIGVAAYFLKAPIKDNIPDIPLGIPAFLGTSISVIISFKLSQSYDRWWEARKIWGSIVNDSRIFALQLQSYLVKGSDKEIRKICFRQIGWCFSLGQSLRGQSGLENMERYLTPEDIDVISRHQNKPLAILQLNSKHIAELKNSDKMDIRSFIHINNTLINFSNAMGMAERIKNTVFPVTYRIFLRSFIYIFVITLSISLAETIEYFEILLLLLISCSFFLLEKSATLLQDPFSNKPTDTPVNSISTTIEINIRQLLNETEIPEPTQPTRYYIM
jgi:ion channel-forming bestrophin family protein